MTDEEEIPYDPSCQGCQIRGYDIDHNDNCSWLAAMRDDMFVLYSDPRFYVAPITPLEPRLDIEGMVATANSITWEYGFKLGFIAAGGDPKKCLATMNAVKEMNMRLPSNA